MKAINRVDLAFIINNTNRTIIFADDLDRILYEYGDDWFIEDGRWVKTKNNEKMKALRKSYDSILASLRPKDKIPPRMLYPD